MSKYNICKLRQDAWLITESQEVGARVNVEVCDSEKEAKEWVKNKESIMEMKYDRFLGRFIPETKFKIRELDREKLTLEMHPDVNIGWRKDRLEIVKQELNQLKERS